MANMATMMEQQSLHMSNMMQVSMNASMVAQQSSETMMKLLIQQLSLREVAGLPVGGASSFSSGASTTTSIEFVGDCICRG